MALAFERWLKKKQGFKVTQSLKLPGLLETLSLKTKVKRKKIKEEEKFYRES